MSILCLFMISIVVHFCRSQSLHGGKSSNKQREVETFTSILLDGEAYSLGSVDKKLHEQPNKIPLKKNDKSGKLRMKSNYRLKGSGLNAAGSTLAARAKPSASLAIADDAPKVKKGRKHVQKRANQMIHHQKRSNNPNKKVKKRNFDAQKGYTWNLGANGQRHEAGYGHVLNYRFAAHPTHSTPASWHVAHKVTENILGVPTISNVQTSEKPLEGDVTRHSDDLLWEKNESSKTYRPERQHHTSTAPNFGANNASGLSFGGNSFQNSNGLNTYQPQINTTVKWFVTPYSAFYASPASPAAIVLRNSPSTFHQSKSETEKLEDQLRTDESEMDDISIVFGCSCDQTVNETCWMTRETGDVVTLSVKIESSKSPSSFQIRWLRVYHIYDSKKGKPLEMEQDKLPWNMVSGSEGRELRLNPVTNTDLDPNCIVAKVFLLSKQRGKMLFTHLKRMIFKIDIPIIDMGILYAGEEVSINLENFISLPERGNLLFDWKLERKPHEARSLPSNVKISSSGRSVVLKELKKGKFGVLNCVIYSSNRYSVAKRRFNILNIAESVKRRSTAKHLGSDKLNLKRSVRCRRVIRRSQERAMQRVEAGAKPKSRKKRFKRMGPYAKEIECEPMRKKLYSRWIRSLFGDDTTPDPRLMPLDKLFELSEEGDGTLDDVIPHEVHYVESKIRLVNGTSGERSVNQFHSPLNCTSDADCGNFAVCAVPQVQLNVSDPVGHCFCRPEFYGDGFTCRKIPSSNHREKRLRRDARKDFAVPEHLFYEQVRRTPPSSTIAGAGDSQAEENLDEPPKVLAFEEEESFLLSDCIDDKDCSNHANCVQPSNGHPFCKCRPGFRGNGIFCWEIIDYVPPEENFLPDEEANPKGATGMPEASLNRLASRTPSTEELDEVY